ncbi:MAG: aminotransferase class V-fold PLP-dependent enzyme [Planctomycetota bacterium]
MSGPEAGLEFCPEHDGAMPKIDIRNVRSFIVGVDREVPDAFGRRVPYVNLDNAATTPPLLPVLDCSRRFYEWYASVHRGTGFKSLLSTHVYEKCREVVAAFVGADLQHHTLIFTPNATHALNKLASRFAGCPDGAIVTTTMEHHSNLLPWRRLGGRILYANIRAADGSLDLEDLESKIRSVSGRLRLVTVTAGSNVTGAMPPIRRIARLAHAHGALIAVDATQIVAHRPFSLGAPDDPARVDFAVFSGHKMYAPFGSGVLVGPRRFFEEGAPDAVGGGTANSVTLDEVLWAEPPEKEEAGTPNVPGAVALASAVRTLQAIGMESIAEHERALTRRALERLSKIPGLRLYGSLDPTLAEDRLGIISMTAAALDHAKLAAALGYEWGIGVRNGCFCAQPYVRILLNLSDEETKAIAERLAAGDHVTVPGFVRASFGVYNTEDEVDVLCEAVRKLLSDGPRQRYVFDAVQGAFVPERPAFRIEDYAPI